MNSFHTVFRDVARSYRLMVAVLAMNTLLVCVILLRNTIGSDFSWLTCLYTTSVAFGYYGLPLLVLVTVIFLLLAPARRVAVVISWIVILFFIYYLFLDSFAYRIVKFHIDSFWIEFILKDYDGLGLSRSTLLGALMVFLGVVALEVGFVAIARMYRIQGRSIIIYPLLVILAFVFSQVIHMVAYHRNEQLITCLTPHFPIYIPFTSSKSAMMYGNLLPSGGADGYKYASIHYPDSGLKFEPPPDEELPNIVIILLESWRYDAFDEEVTPHIHALSRKSSVFLDHLSSGNQTTCGVFGLFYGLHPTYWKAVKANSSLIDNPVLIDVLRDRDYTFGVYARSNFDRHKIKDTIFSGIEVHETFAGNTFPEQDEDLTRQVRAFMEEQVRNEQRFLAFAFYKSTHYPYEYPEEQGIFNDYKNMRMGLTNGDTDPTPYINDYHNAVHYVDSLVGEIIDHLELLGEMENTVIVVTTDHGEAFNDNGANYWGHSSSFTQYQIRVPLILYAPDRPPRQVEYRTTHIDLAPTLLQEHFGCLSDIHDFSNGRNLFDETAAPRSLVVGSYINHAFIFGDDVYEVWPLYTKKYKLHDVNLKASPPDQDLLKVIMEEINHFSDR